VLLRKHTELERDYLQLKNRFVKQQTKMERCLQRLNEMIHNHECDIALIAKSEEVIRRLSQANNQAENRLQKAQDKVQKLETALATVTRDRS